MCYESVKGLLFSRSCINFLTNSVDVSNECIAAFRELMYKRGADKPTFVIYKISDDQRSIIVEESSSEKNYETFRQRLTSSVDHAGNRAPRYAVYDVEYDLNDDGRRYDIASISLLVAIVRC